HARNSEGDAVAEENVGERLADDRLHAPAQHRLRRVLARRAATEVLVDDGDARALRLEARVVHDVLLLRSRGVEAHVIEGVLSQAVEGDRLHEARRDDAIGIDIVAAQRNRLARDLSYFDQITHSSPCGLWRMAY